MPTQNHVPPPFDPPIPLLAQRKGGLPSWNVSEFVGSPLITTSVADHCCLACRRPISCFSRRVVSPVDPLARFAHICTRSPFPGRHFPPPSIGQCSRMPQVYIWCFYFYIESVVCCLTCGLLASEPVFLPLPCANATTPSQMNSTLAPVILRECNYIFDPACS
jgi:hypothetical protein